MAEQFDLRVNIEINGTDERGGYTGERLSVQETFRLPVSGFTEIAQVLGRFHELAGKIRDGQ